MLRGAHAQTGNPDLLDGLPLSSTGDTAKLIVQQNGEPGRSRLIHLVPHRARIGTSSKRVPSLMQGTRMAGWPEWSGRGPSPVTSST